jgi:hypothetical protein
MIRLLSILCLLALTSCQVTLLRVGDAPVQKKLKQPLLVPILHEGQERYQLVDNPSWPYVYQGKTEEIPRGYVLDGFSIPRPFWSFMSRDGLQRAPAAFHDHSYQRSGVLLNGTRITRRESDQELRDCMVRVGIPQWRANITYWAVRAGGASSWGGNTPIVLPVEESRMAAHKKRTFAPKHLYAR